MRVDREQKASQGPVLEQELSGEAMDISKLDPALGFSDFVEEKYHVVKKHVPHMVNGTDVAEDEDTDDAIGLEEHKAALDQYKEIAIPKWLKDYIAEKHIVLDRYHHAISWMKSKTLPDWMLYYFMWHKEQRALLTEDNWKSQRFLVLTCYTGQSCGNVAHRIRPLAAHLRVAANSKRLLMIHWDKPNSTFRCSYICAIGGGTGGEGRVVVVVACFVARLTVPFLAS